jgi:hypothetical protein
MSNKKFFAGLIIDSTIFGLDKIQLLSKVEQDLQNTNLYKTIQIIEICYNLEKMANALPEDMFKTNLKQVFSLELPKHTCYTIDENSQINCLDFYNNYIKRKEVNAQILKQVKKQEGGMGMMLTAAFTALAIIHASTASVFNSDKFVDQQLAKRGIDPNPKEPTSFFNSAKETVLSVFGKSEPNPNVLSAAEVKRYNELELNYAGKCTYLAYIAELCTGGCPTEEEWLKRDPNIVNEIINSQNSGSYDPSDEYSRMHEEYRSTHQPNDHFLVGSYSMIGVGHMNELTVPSSGKGQDPEWFRKYFSSGDKSYKQGDKSDIAIATVFKPKHAFNMLYNRNTKKLCIHEVNYELEYDFYLVKIRPPSYICEEGFFTNEQLNKLAKISKVSPVVDVVSPGTNIISYYEKLTRTDSTITHITPSEKIFLHDNENNSGNINEYITIHEKVNDAIIQGKYKTYKMMKEHLTHHNPEIIEIYGSLVQNIEKLLKDPSNEKKYNKEIKTLQENANKINKEEEQKWRDRSEQLERENNERNQQLVPYDTNREIIPYNKKQRTRRGGKRNRKSRRSRTFKKKRR